LGDCERIAHGLRLPGVETLGEQRALADEQNVFGWQKDRRGIGVQHAPLPGGVQCRHVHASAFRDTGSIEEEMAAVREKLGKPVNLLR
jgi:hypothetical protein